MPYPKSQTNAPIVGDLLPEVIEIVRDAGGHLRKEFHRKSGPRGAGYHADIDREIETYLRERLLHILNVGWLGEETGRQLSRSPDVWVVDPNDGTSAFLQGMRGSSISVALVRRGRPVLGVVYAPTAPDDRGDLFSWAEGVPLTRNGQVCQLERDVAPNSRKVIVAMNEQAGNFASVNTRVLSPARFRSTPSIAYRLALAAVGEVDGAVSLGHIAAWDVAGGHALLQGADRMLVDYHGRPLNYDEGQLIDGCFGGSQAVVEELVGRNLRSAYGRGQLHRADARPKQPVWEPGTLSRAQGTLLGQIAGDALGSAVEFMTEGAIAILYPDGVADPIDGGAWNTIAGQATDDSELALALARSLVAESCFDKAAITSAYVAWLKSGPFDIGHTIGTSIRQLARGQQPQNASRSNGALMRVSPIGIFHTGNPETAARDAARDASLTHPDPVCVSASSAFAAAIAVGIDGGNRDAMWSAAFGHCGSGPGALIIKDCLTAAKTQRPEDYQTQMGWVLIAFQNAFYHLLRGTRFADAVRETAAYGGDTDTNSAICGALVGSVEGRDAIPVYWRNLILSCRPGASTEDARSRPTNYWSDDTLELAEALLSAGLSKLTQTEVVQDQHLKIASKYTVRLGGKNIQANSLAELLVWSLEHLESLKPGTLELLSHVSRGKRRMVARKITSLYPGRSDLCDFYRRLGTSWFVGTNNSRKDVQSILIHAFVASGLDGLAPLIIHNDDKPLPPITDLLK